MSQHPAGYAALPGRNPKTLQLEPVGNASGAVRALPDYDLIVIGGGINGSGIAREAAERGLAVLLLEKEDFGSGTSAYSSRLIHGGLRYLANLEFDLVAESLRERELLLRHAPHLVRPLPMAIPVYAYSEKPRWMIGLGMLLYDLLSWGKSMPAHRMYGKAGFQARYPGINTERLQGGPVYYDAQVELPERICVENVLAAKETGNATVLNHARVTGFLIEQSTVQGVLFTDALSGQRYTARGKAVINASGPWVDALMGLADSHPARRIGGTKGSHIVVRRFAGGPETALYVEARSDGRPFFIIPWREDYYLIGTTDLRFEGNLDAVAADRDEIAYLLAETNHVLPGAKLTVRDVLYSYAGVRPLPYTQGKTAGRITRKHLIEDHARNQRHPLKGLVSIIGGKLTTYRSLAEEAVDYVIRAYAIRQTDGSGIPPSDTRRKPLPGGVGIEDWPTWKKTQKAALSERYELDEPMVSRWLSIYGSRLERVLALTLENPDWKRPLYAGCQSIGAQVVYAVRAELACSVQDVMLRRLGCALDADVGLKALEPVSQLMATELGWDQARLNAEVAAYKTLVETRNLAFLGQAPSPEKQAAAAEP